jgi:hypothetical protein
VELTEASAGVFDFTWCRRSIVPPSSADGAIDLSYDQVAVKDAIVGKFRW